MPEKPYIELRYSTPNKVLIGATLVSGDLRVDLPNLVEAEVRASATAPCWTELTFYGMHSVEEWED